MSAEGARGGAAAPSPSADLSVDNRAGEYDEELVRIADYVCGYEDGSEEAMTIAHYCLLDSIGCALRALAEPECCKLLGPVVTGGDVPMGARVVGTRHQLDPVKAAFDNGALIRWLDYNDTWLAAEWNHPSDNLGAILSVGDYISRRRRFGGDVPVTVSDLLMAMVKAYEIQGVIALENAFNRRGIDHVVLVKAASAALASYLMTGDRLQVMDALSHAWVDGQSLRTYRHAPNTGSRKSWAAGDATSRGVRLAMMVAAGEHGMHTAFTAPNWGFNDCVLGGESLRFGRDFGCYVMENILFKVSYPAEFHAQTAVECALKLHAQVEGRVGDIERVEIATQESAVRIISKKGPLRNYADRDHCLQYMVAVPLLYGRLTERDYSDAVAADPRIDALRDKMAVTEDKRYSKEYLDPDKRSIANAVQVFFRDGTSTPKVEVEYPVGHRKRREESLPLLEEKFLDSLATRYPARRATLLERLCLVDPERLADMPVAAFMDLLAI